MFNIINKKFVKKNLGRGNEEGEDNEIEKNEGND